MKLIKSFLLCGLLGVTLLAGLLSPDGIMLILDKEINGQQWFVAETENTFIYEGTLENRVRALEAWQNGSTGVLYAKQSVEDAVNAADVWDTLYDAGLLPIDASEVQVDIKRFSLTPYLLSAEYQYWDITCASADGSLHVIMDADTRAYLRIDFTYDPQILSEWMQITGEGFDTEYKLDTLMHDYASFLGIGLLADLEYADGTAIQGYESDIKGTAFVASLRYAPNQGLLIYKLFANPLL